MSCRSLRRIASSTRFDAYGKEPIMLRPGRVIPALIRVVVAAVLVNLAPFLPRSAQGATPQTIVIDGVNDFDSSNRIDNDSGDTQSQNWCPGDPESESPMDLGSVYITNDADYLYFGVEFDPDCFRSQPPFLQLGLAIDAVAASGGTDDPMGRQITWSGVSDKPDFCIYDALDLNNLEVLFQWNSGSSTWNAL